MQQENAELSEAFIERQQARLETMRDQFSGMQGDAEAEQRTLLDQNAGEPGDSGDEAANRAQLEIDEGLRNEDEQRLSAVKRALEKIRECSYGLSDGSGEPIPQARLEAMPEALYTVEEEEQRERG